MKNLIRKILRESDFDWADEISPRNIEVGTKIISNYAPHIDYFVVTGVDEVSIDLAPHDDLNNTYGIDNTEVDEYLETGWWAIIGSIDDINESIDDFDFVDLADPYEKFVKNKHDLREMDKVIVDGTEDDLTFNNEHGIVMNDGNTYSPNLEICFKEMVGNDSNSTYNKWGCDNVWSFNVREFVAGGGTIIKM